MMKMWRSSFLKVLIVVIILLIHFLWNYSSTLSPKEEATTQRPLAVHWVTMKKDHHDSKNLTQSTRKPERIVVSFVVCGYSRFNESLNVAKSVLVFTKSPVHFVIYTDDELKDKADKVMQKWKNITKDMDYEIHEINFPELNKKEWMELFRKCASQRLFIPKLLTHIEALIYVDTDTLFLGPVEELWSYFSRFDSYQMSAMALEHESPSMSWYPRFARHPFYGKLGLNSGVMLMNLTRMRDFRWTESVTNIFHEWKLYIPWGDQDIINIVFSEYSRGVLELPCRFNFRADQCTWGAACAGAGAGVGVLHGSRAAFHNGKQPAFKAIYRAINEYQLGTDPQILLASMKKYLAEAPPSNCGNMSELFLKVPTETLKVPSTRRRHWAMRPSTLQNTAQNSLVTVVA